MIAPSLALFLPSNNSTVPFSRPTFVWQSLRDTSIPETFAYQVVVSKSLGFDTAETSAVLADTLWKPIRNLNSGQSYFWKLVAVGDNGNEVVSQPAKVTIQISFAPILPVPNAVLKIRRPTFIWRPIRDTSTVGPFDYQVMLSTDSNFTEIQVSDYFSDTTWKANFSLEAGQNYYWRAFAASNSGDTVAGTVSKFLIVALPVNLYLPSSATRLKQPSFAWQKVIDTSTAETFSYRVILSNDAGFFTAESSTILTDTLWKVPHKLNLSGVYYWKVEGVSDSGGSVFSNVQNFTVLPPTLIPRLPLENANVREREPTLTWSSVRDSSIPDTFLYRVQVALNGNFQNAFESPFLADTSWQISGALQVGGVYFWKVMAFYSADEDTVQPSSIIFFREQPSRIIIPDDKGKIQEGIDVSLNGDTIWVKPGTYYENIFFKGKRVKLISEAGPEATTIAKYVDGLQLVNFGSAEDTTTLLSGFTITGANQVAGGAAIKISGASPRIENNRIVGNSGDAGAIWVEGGFPRIRRNVIAKDTGEAAILFFGNSGGAVINCAVADNFGHGIQMDAATSIQVTNSIIAFNSRYGIRSINGTNLNSSISYNDIFGNSAGHFFAILPSTGNLHADPLFLGGSPFSYHLSSVSPCIDSGDPGYAVPAGGGSRIDMGAFEFILTRGDLNGDGIFTAADIVLELNCVFLSTGNCNLTIADLNCDSQLLPTDVVLILSFVFLGSPFPC